MSNHTDKENVMTNQAVLHGTFDVTDATSTESPLRVGQTVRILKGRHAGRLSKVVRLSCLKYGVGLDIVDNCCMGLWCRMANVEIVAQ